MATASLTTTPTTIDTGASDNVSITNTGTVDVTITRGSQSFTLRPTQGRVIYPEGTAVTAATTSGTGSVSYAATAPRQSQAVQFAADPAFTGTYARRLTEWRLTGLTSVVGSAPTVTYGAHMGNPTVSGAVKTPISDNVFRKYGQPFASWGSTVGAQSAAYRNAASPNSATPTTIEFCTDAATVEVHGISTGTTATWWNLLVDGQWAFSSAQFPAKNAGTEFWATIAFGSSAQRTLTWVSDNSFPISEVAVGPTSTLYQSDVRPGPRIAIMGDSYGQGVSQYVGAGKGYALLCHLLGWRDQFHSLLGGTGYLKVNGSYPKFRDRMPALTAVSPDIVFTPGGLNDQGQQTKAVLQAETTTYYAALRAALPNAILIALGPFCPNGANASTSNYTDVRDAIKNGIATVSGPWLYIDNLTDTWVHSDGRTGSGTASAPWQTGSGKVGATTGSGNGDVYVDTDGTHPTTAGDQYLARRMLGAIRAGLNMV
jgi:lysophospholipase L1-like esterase